MPTGASPTAAPSLLSLNATAAQPSVSFCNASCSTNSLWILGVALGLLGSICINTGALRRGPAAPGARSCPGAVAGSWGAAATRGPPGNNIQSLGLHQLAEAARLATELTGDATDRSLPPQDPTKSRVWRVGTAVFLTGSLLNFASYGLAPAQMLAPLESIQ
jgi:hypothetical protein